MAIRDAFPHTRRPLPWVLAAFMAMVFFIPIDSTELKVKVGVDSHPDRLAIALVILAWICFGGDQRALLRTRRSKRTIVAALVFLLIALASIVADAPRIVNVGLFKLAEDHFVLLASFVVLLWFVLTALRFEDLRGFASYLIGLGVLMGLGIVYERHSGHNLFYEWSKSLLSPIATVAPSPTRIHATPNVEEGRLLVVGPTQHALAATAVLVMVMPFALVRMFDAQTRRSWWLNALAFLVMVAGAVATDRKTALLVPLALIVYFAIYRPRQVLRMLPVGLIVLVGIAHVASPGSLGTFANLGNDVHSGSTVHRVGDFADLRPDILAMPILGRGYGAVNVLQPENYRINDNEYLDILWNMGILGLLAFLSVILAPIVLARKAIRTRGPTISSLALASSGGCVAFLAVCGLFDSLGYPQAPYVFVTVAAITTIVCAGPEGNVVSARSAMLRARARSMPRPAAVLTAEQAR